MTKYRIAARIDNNQEEIVKQLRSIPGVTVELSHDDILCGYQGVTRWYELKNPDCVSKKTGKILESAIQPDQKRIRSTFTGHYRIVSTIEEILIDLNLLG